jgi:glyoxylase-like metal-dependent hydrolase (beta-lactamase superfamily II)
VVTGDHVLYHITPNICRWGGVADSLGDYLASLEKIRALAADTVLPAHRTAEGSLERRVDELTAHHRRRLADARRTLLSAPGLTAYEIAGRMAWEIRCRTWADFPLTQKFFAVGEALAHLDYLRARGQAVCREENGQRRWYAAGGKGFSNTIS